MSHPSELVLDALHLGVLDEAVRAQTVAHAETCTACRERMRIAEASRLRFVQHVLPRQLPVIAARRRRSLFAWLLPPLVAAAAAAGFLVLRADREPPVFGIKGGPVFQVFASHDDHVVQLHDGMALAPGDRIRFVVKGAAAQHLLVASIDAAGVATVYFPFGGTASAQLPAAQMVELPGSVILDGTLGPERVYAVFSRAPIAAAPVLAALRAGQPVTAGDTQLSLRFEKAR